MASRIVPLLKHNVPYNTDYSPEQCAERLQEYGDKLLSDNPASDMTIQWSGVKAVYGGSVLGRRIDGHLVVGGEEVKTVTTIPLLAVPFKGKIRAKITEHIGKALEIADSSDTN